MRAGRPGAAVGWMALGLVAITAGGCGWDVDLAGARLLCPDERCPADQRCEDGRCTSADAFVPPPWWDTTWTTRRRLLVTNDADEPTPEGLPVVIHTDLATLGVADYVEVTVVAWDGARWTRLDFYEIRQRADAGDALWFRLPASIPAGTRDGRVWLYVGNPSPPPQLAGDAVWEQIDYFGGAALDGARWTSTGDVSLVDDDLVVGPGGQVRSLRTWPTGVAVDVAVETPVWSPTMWLGFQRAADLDDDPPLVRWASTAGGLRPEVEIAAAGTTWTGTAIAAPTSRAELSVERFDDRARFGADSRPVEDRTLATPFTDPLQIRLGNTGTTPFVLPSLRVRLAMDPAPTVDVGEPEPVP